MKLTVIGGGGVRSPLFVASALKRAERSGLDELCLMDINGVKLETIASLCQQLVKRSGSPVRITTTTNAHQALEGASHIVTTIRVGNEAGRVLDERIALRQGVIGQETTGPGGFAMAMRSIPAILQYAEMASKLCPNAWIFNFTNPAGLVTQALHRQGYTRAVGICDGANLAQHDAAKWLETSPDSLRTEVFGLNHLSWTKRIWQEGRDMLPGLLQNPRFCAESSIKVFEPELIAALGLFPNEYLYYYYYAAQALAKLNNEECTRGEEVLLLNQRLLNILQQIDMEQAPEQALSAYLAYEKRRSSTYMHYASPEGMSMEEADEMDFSGELLTPEAGEGYAGISLDIITALERNEPYYTALNTTNAGAVPGIDHQDVVEVSCLVNDGRVTPLPIDEVPTQVRGLLYQMKAYENLAVEAITSRSREKGILALMSHPLVLSYSKASRLIDDYLQAHAPYVGEWS